MASSNTCWGIELGSGAIKALKLERSGDEVKVLEFANIPHKRVLSTPDIDENDAIRVALGELVTRFDLSGSQVAIGVPGKSAFARFAKLPPVEPKKIPDIVKFEAVQQIPFPIEQVEWDYQTFMSQDSPDVEVGIFAITRDRVMEKLALWQDVGVTPDYVTINPLAVYNAVAWDQSFGPKTPGTVILDVGTASSDLIVAEPGRLWIRTFKIGGHQFTEALVNAFKLSYTKAETLKRQAEQSKHARHVFQAMRPVFSDLAQEVQRSIGYYQSSHKDANLTRLIGLGSTFQLPGLRKYLSQTLQMEVVRLEQFSRLSVEGASAGEFQASTVNLATAYGLALQGLDFDFGIMANLMPAQVVREVIWKQKVKWFAVAAGLSLAAGGVSFVRPMMDANVVAAPLPRVVSDTTNLASTKKAEWNEVSKDFAPDYLAANALNMTGGREIIPLLVNDLGLMMKYADDAAVKDKKPGVIFTDFSTGYVGPAPSNPEDPNAGFEDPAGGGPKRKVTVEVVVTTVRENPNPFIVSTLSKWVIDHAEREGLPYTLDPKSIRLVEERGKIPEAGASQPTEWTAPPGSSGGPGAGGSTSRPQTPPGSRPGGGRFNRPVEDRDERGPGPGGRGGTAGGGRRAGGDGALPPEGAGEGGGGGVGQTAVPGAGQQDVERLAPFLPLPPDGPPGSTISKFTIRFDAVIRPPKAPEGTT